MELEKKAREVAGLLQRTPVLQEYYRAGEVLKKDLEARRLLRYYQRAQEKLRGIIAQGETPADYLVDDFEELQEEFKGNPIIQDYLSARERAVQLVAGINEIIRTETGIPGGGCSGCRCQH